MNPDYYDEYTTQELVGFEYLMEELMGEDGWDTDPED